MYLINKCQCLVAAPTFSEGGNLATRINLEHRKTYIRDKCFVELHSKIMSVLLLATIVLLCVSEVISNCPPDSGK